MWNSIRIFRYNYKDSKKSAAKRPVFCCEEFSPLQLVIFNSEIFSVAQCFVFGKLKTLDFHLPLVSIVIQILIFFNWSPWLR